MANSIGNIVSRLQGLKNVSGRRKVMPENEILQNLTAPETDVTGTAQPLPNFANFQQPTENLPEPDLGGELTSQSYDVRANSVAVPQPVEPNQDEGFNASLRKLGANLWNSFKEGWTPGLDPAVQQRLKQEAPPIATAQVEESEGIPPISASQEETLANPQWAKAPEPSPGILGAISDYFNPTKRAEMGQYNQDTITRSQLSAQGKNPDEVLAERHQKLAQEVEQAVERPGEKAVFGAAREIENNPALSAQFKQITGIDFEPQIAAQVSEHEEAMQGVEDALNGINTQLSETAEGIKQRILNNQTNESDNLYIGLALLMPLIIGGVFGKEAGLGALGGAAQGFANVLGNRQKAIREDEDALVGINKEKANTQAKLADIGLEKAKLGPALRKLLPEDPNAHLVGMRMAEWTDPNTGQTVQGVEVKPGLIARPEFVASKDGRNDMLKAANELSEVKTYVDEINDLTDDIAQIVPQLKDVNSLQKYLTNIISGKVPGATSRLTEDVMFNGRKVNAGVLLEEKLGFLANAYGMAKELGQLDRAAQSHIRKIIDNPTTTLLTGQDSLNQILEIRDLAQKGLIRNAANKGFYPEFVISDLQPSNDVLNNRLNENKQKQRVNNIKKTLLASETNYAQ